MPSSFLLVADDPELLKAAQCLAHDLSTCSLASLQNAQIPQIGLLIRCHNEPPAALDWQHGTGLLLGELAGWGGLTLPLPEHLAREQLSKIVATAMRLWQGQQEHLALRETLAQQQRAIDEVTQIGIALTSERELPRLLERILSEGRRLADCEAASLFLVERSSNTPAQLRFRLFQNETLPETSFVEASVPLNEHSIAGYVALHDTGLNLPDVYALPPELPYRFNRNFDQQSGYRSREMLTLPMHNPRGEIIGVLQFLNRKQTALQFQPFPADLVRKLEALASQSGVAIDNSLLLEDIRRLFEGFVDASVKAIEARDPITSGHSFRVADFTCLLADALARAPSAALRDKALTPTQWRELRYAALLHDFGKVGVREHVLQKAKKLSDEQLANIQLRLAWMRERLLREAIQQQWSEEKLAMQLAEIERHQNLLCQANEPAVLHQDHQHALCCVRDLEVPDNPWGHPGLISKQEYLALSVTRGSLTMEERIEIESHVNHTFAFLSKIPWPRDLANLPFYAAAHHEKLDGSGYPLQLEAESIPLQVRMMTIADIFDALTARDRPYKAAMPIERALDILLDEAREGKVDHELLTLFIDSRAFLGPPST